jgi:hypothetical protein
MSQILKYYLDQKPLSNSDIEHLKKSKKKFTDELFPPNDNSLFSANKEGIFLDQNLGKKIAEKFVKSLKYIWIYRFCFVSLQKQKYNYLKLWQTKDP